MPAPTVLVILAEGFEEIEAVTPIDILRRAGAEVRIAAAGEGIHVRGRSGIVMHAEVALGSVENETFHCILLPGGPGVKVLRSDSRVLAIVRKQAARNGWIAAICAAPLVLKDAGILEGHSYTAHSSTLAELPAALGGERVVVDGRIITSRGAGTALDFGLRLASCLISAATASEITTSICA